MLTFIPAAAAAFAAFMFVRTGDSGYADDGIITNTAWMFYVTFFLSSALGLPLVLWHISKMDWRSVAFHFGGDLTTIVGLGIFVFLSQSVDGMEKIG
jgi:hypothetical protein